MEFERARSEEQKNIRIKQITDGARKQFSESKYEDITLASIAKELSFTRANLYKYISTKEEIFLYIIADDLKAWTDDIISRMSGMVNPEVKVFSKMWADTFSGHTDFIKVFSLLYSTIEQNVTIEKLVPYKRSFLAEMQRVLETLCGVFPEMGMDKAYKFLEMQMYFLSGFYPATIGNEVQMKACEQLGIPYELPSLKEVSTEFIEMLLRNLV